MPGTPDAVVVGSGPNGLSAAIVLAQAGRRVVVFEAAPVVGGGARSAELTLPGFVHDLCSAVHPLAVLSPFFKTLPLQQYGVEWVVPPGMLAHPFDDGRAALMGKSVEETAMRLGRDRQAYLDVMGTAVEHWALLEPFVLGPPVWPTRPVHLARLGLRMLQSVSTLVQRQFRETLTRGLYAGIAGHGMLPLDRRPTAAFAIVLGAAAHVGGWVFPRGGAQRLSDALAAYLRSLGGEIVTDAPVTSIDELPPARAVLCDLSPKPLLRIAGRHLPDWYRRKLERYRYGMGVYKVDWALDGPVPWRAAECARAGTVHLGGTFDEIAAAEREAWRGEVPERPFVLLSQPTLFDETRAPRGRHTAWGYCHVPHGSSADMLSRIEAQIERFAPAAGPATVQCDWLARRSLVRTSTTRDMKRGKFSYNDQNA